MDFSLLTSGFAPGDLAHIEVWAGTSNCADDTNRSAAGKSVHPCWQVAPSVTSVTQTVAVSVFARDVLRYEGPPAFNASQTYDKAFHASDGGAAACFTQASDAAITLSIYFLAVNSQGYAIGTGHQYSFVADTVGPPPPTVAPLLPGDTMLSVSWAPVSNDPDVKGYVLYSNPPAGGLASSGCNCSSPGAAGVPGQPFNLDATATPPVAGEGEGEGGTVFRQSGGTPGAVTAGPVGEGGEPPGSDADPGDDGAAQESDGALAGDVGEGAAPAIGDARAEASAIGASVTRSGSTTTECLDPTLQSAIPIGTAIVPADALRADAAADAGTGAGAGGDAGLPPVIGPGISTIPADYNAGRVAVGTNSIAIRGLENGILHHVVVASIDGSDNIGPPSALRCASPQPVDDYWATYQKEGGSAGGCALESGLPGFDGRAGLPIVVALAWWARRRRQGRASASHAPHERR